jgi:TolB-like protein/DNA-binding winged helix-turn-helix (wHTH) protein
MLYVFENYVLDLDRCELRRGDTLIPLHPQVFDILTYLVQNRDHVVTKDDLHRTIWRGRTVSESALATRINAVRQAVADSGTEQRLIKTLQRKGFRFVGAVSERPVSVDAATFACAASPASGLDRTPLSRTADLATDAPGQQTHDNVGSLWRVAGSRRLALVFLASLVGLGAWRLYGKTREDPGPDMPSIAVLPFVNLSGDPEQEYFADGMVDQITTLLSRIPWLRVASRTSTFALKGQNFDMRDIGRRLGVRYVVEGSVSKAGNQTRIIAQLIDAGSSIHIWATRAGGSLDNIFDLQNRLTRNIVGAIEPKLLRAEIDRAKRKRPESLDAYDYYLRALPSSYRPSPDSSSEALLLLENAFRLDPNFPPANVLAAWLYYHRVASTWSKSPQRDRDMAIRLARNAIAHGDDDPFVLALGGFVLASVGGNVDIGLSAANRAVEIIPNSAFVLQMAGWITTFTADQDQALMYFKAAVRLSPSDPLTYRALTGAAAASVLAGHFVDAVRFGEEARYHYADWGPTYCFLAAAYAQLGEGSKAAEALANLFTVEPTVTISHLQSLLPYQDKEQAERVWDGLRKAGMPA